MAKKKTTPPDEQPMETLSTTESGGEDYAGQLPEAAEFPEDVPTEEHVEEDVSGNALSDDTQFNDNPADDAFPSNDPFDDIPSDETASLDDPLDGTPSEDMPPEHDFPEEEDTPFPDMEDDAEYQQSANDAETESDDPEYGALLQELGETDQGNDGEDDPLTLDPLPGEEGSTDMQPLVPTEMEVDVAGEEPIQPQRPRGRPRRVEPAATAAPASDPRRDRVLTIEARDEVQTAEEQEAVIWHEIQNAHWTRRILTGTLDGVEQTESGLTVAVVNYKGFRVAIPVKEMLLFTGKLPSGPEYMELMSRMRGILTARLGSEIDFIVKGHENKTRSVVASRKDAMYRKRQSFYLDTNELGQPMIYEGRVVQARVVAVAEKVVRVEVFGVECAILARGLSRAWVGNAADHYHVGDRILVRVQKISGTTVEDLSITADVRSTSASTASDDLKKCVRQGRYAGRVTDVRGGVLYVRLNNGVNAIAHSCYDRRSPGKGDDVSLSVTRLDEEQGVAVGIITRIIKQNL